MRRKKKKKKERKKMTKSDFFGGLFLSSRVLKGTFATAFSDIMNLSPAPKVIAGSDITR